MPPYESKKDNESDHSSSDEESIGLFGIPVNDDDAGDSKPATPLPLKAVRIGVSKLVHCHPCPHRLVKIFVVSHCV